MSFSQLNMMVQIGKFTASPDFTGDKMNSVSAAASGMCKWVHAMETYGYVAKDVAPKRAKLKAAQDNLAKKQSALALAQEQLAVVLAKVQALKNRYVGLVMGGVQGKAALGLGLFVHGFLRVVLHCTQAAQQPDDFCWRLFDLAATQDLVS